MSDPIIQIDTREQQPLPISDFGTARVTMATGDYGIAGFSDLENPAFCVERKALPDLIGSLSTHRDRFLKEVQRMRAYRFRALLIEADEGQVARGEYRSRMSPESVLQTLSALQTRANVHIVWAGTPDGAARWLERAVRQFCRGIEKDAARLTQRSG